jgi:hypothetical protein
LTSLPLGARFQIPPSLGEVPTIPDTKLATLEKMPSMAQCLDEISRAKSLRLSERSSKERKANATASKPQKKAAAV